HPLERTFHLVNQDLGDAHGAQFQRAQTKRGTLSLNRSTEADAVDVLEDGQVLESLRFNLEPPKCFTLFSDDRAVVGTIYALYLFDARAGNRLKSSQGHTGNIGAVSPSPGNRSLLSASNDQTLRIWDPDHDEPLLSLFVAGDDWVAWTPEGYYAAS